MTEPYGYKKTQAALPDSTGEWLERKIQEALERSTDLKMYVWSVHPYWIAVTHARSVQEARQFMAEYMGTGDGSCVMREKARTHIQTQAPAIWVGPNAEFELTDSAEVEEAEAELAALREERDGLAANYKETADLLEVAVLAAEKFTTERDGLAACLDGGYKLHCDNLDRRENGDGMDAMRATGEWVDENIRMLESAAEVLKVRDAAKFAEGWKAGLLGAADKLTAEGWRITPDILRKLAEESTNA